MRRSLSFVIFVSVALPVAAAESPPPLDFLHDIRPILSNHCWNCHGPDAGTREAGLRLDERTAALKAVDSGQRAIVPGDPAASELIARIHAQDDSQMPPAAFGKPLNDTQRALLKRWIAEGAHYAGHWAFQTPQRPALPAVKQTAWPLNEVDHFVLARLEQNGLPPSPEMDRSLWLRRVTLDLTGLPPTPDERAAFMSDSSPLAFQSVVERLLSSARFSERMAMHWLDAARYADTNGYNNDEVRTLWPWRDWVISAFARNLPYDQFLTEQLAGDLLPDATQDQKVATGFNRNHVLTTEGGIIEEEYRVEYVADRVHTTATVFLGLSMQCARCHDHKYDPWSQRDYYRFAAYFDNVPDKVVPYSKGRMAEPLLKAPSPLQQTEQQSLAARQTVLQQILVQRQNEVTDEVVRWEAELTAEQRSAAKIAALDAHFPLDDATAELVQEVVQHQPVTIQGTAVLAEGRFGQAREFDGASSIESATVGVFEADQPCSFAAWIFPTSTQPSAVLSRMDDAAAYRGYDVLLGDAKLSTHFVHQWPDRGFNVVARQPMSLQQWHHVLVTYDGSRAAAGVKLYVDGQLQEVDIPVNHPLDGTLLTEKPFHIGKRQESCGFHGRIDDVRLYRRALSVDEARELAQGSSLDLVEDVLAVPAIERSPVQQARLRDYYLQHVDPASQTARSELAQLAAHQKALDEAIPVTMVMAEMTPRRVTHVLNRGQYDQPGDVVEPGIPHLFEQPGAAVSNRLELARWLTSPEHPLTARVAVNRWWEMLYGTGLVETTEDFGIQGALPTHPELLDWLATELVRSGWDTRHVLKLMVLSATYRQSSMATPELLDRDPKNQLLARGPRYRLPAEMVRDNALAISGLLIDQLGGPSVKPYQPEGLWEDVSVERRDKYVPDPGAGLYRRSMYTFWKRTCPPPGMAAFDAPDRETCVIRRARTNTPLQALVLLNDPTYVEAARQFAQQVLQSAATNQERLDAAFQAAVCRSPTAEESAILLDILQAALARFEEQPQAANDLLAVGNSLRKPEQSAVELAGWTVLTNMILNLDETISKP